MHNEISRFSKSNETHTGSIKPIQIQQSSGLPNPYGFSSKAKLRQGHSKTLAGVSDERLMIHSSYWIESGYTKTFKSTDLALRQTHKPTSRDIRVQGLGFAAKNIQKHSEKHSKTFKTFTFTQTIQNIQKHLKVLWHKILGLGVPLWILAHQCQVEPIGRNLHSTKNKS